MKVILIFSLLFRFVGYHFWLPSFGVGINPKVFVSPAADFFDNLTFTESFAMKQTGSSVIDPFHFIVWAENFIFYERYSKIICRNEELC